MQFITTSSITISATPVEPAEDWHDYANCLDVDPEVFFPEQYGSTREAKEICRGCEVRHDCLEFALQNGEKFGVWGGLSERERRRIRRQRAQVARSTLGTLHDGRMEVAFPELPPPEPLAYGRPVLLVALQQTPSIDMQL